MKKAVAGILIAALLMSLLSGCASRDRVASGTVDGQELAEYLLEHATFDNELSKMENAEVREIYSLDMTAIKDMYVMTGAEDSCEEIAIFEAISDAGASDVKDRVIRHIQLQQQAHSAVEGEYEKILEPVFLNYGVYIIFCASADNEAAKAAAKEYLGQE